MSKMGDKHWTPEQVSYLREAYMTGVAPVEISSVTGKTVDAVRTKALRLSLSRPTDEAPDGHKRCAHCREIKPVSAFHRKPPGWQSWCKKCMNEEHLAWQKNNKPRLAAYRYVRIARNPDQMAAVEARSHHKRMAVVKDGHDLTAAEWREILVQHKGICPMCHQPFTDDNPPTRDCINPLSKGGRLTASNVQPLHLSCNCRKRDKEMEATR